MKEADADADADRTGKKKRYRTKHYLCKNEKERKKIRQWGRLFSVEGSGGASWATQFKAWMGPEMDRECDKQKDLFINVYVHW